MAKVSEDLIKELKNLSNDELVKIIVRFSRKNTEMNKTLEFELVDSENTEELLTDLKGLINSELGFIDGRIIQKGLANAIGNCIVEINDFKKVTKSKYHETLAVEETLNIIFSKYIKDFGTCFTIFDSKVASLAKRYFNLVLSLHEDYHIEFKDNFERILKIVKKECRHFTSIYHLADSFEKMKELKSIKN
jgi:hypothetical protein